MMHKQHAVTLSKPWPHLESFGAHMRQVMAKLKHVVEIPMGYQDETGFHLGTESAPKVN
jgi:hypothetical protein